MFPQGIFMDGSLGQEFHFLLQPVNRIIMGNLLILIESNDRMLLREGGVL